MSDVAAAVVSCPHCGAEEPATLFSSLNGDAIEAQRMAILDGHFEARRCARCDQSFRPEHRLLYTRQSARAFIVMHPIHERRGSVALERQVERVIAREIAAAPPVAASALRGIRPRLVFGQHMLSEAVREVEAGIDAALLECAKMFAIRHNLDPLMGLGPFELCFERIAPDGAIECGVHALDTGDRRAAISLPPIALLEAREHQRELETRWPELWTRPYASISRYLYPVAEDG